MLPTSLPERFWCDTCWCHADKLFTIDVSVHTPGFRSKKNIKNKNQDFIKVVYNVKNEGKIYPDSNFQHSQ